MKTEAQRPTTDGQVSTMDEWLYCFLPAMNSQEFPDLDEELRKRQVVAQAAELRDGGGRVYRVHRSCLNKLPRDEKGPYLGDDESGHGLYNWQGPDNKGPWQNIFGQGSAP